MIDILAPLGEGAPDPRRIEQCEAERDAAQISGEIVVCRQISEDNSQSYSGGRDAAQDRYARETMYAGDPQAPDVAGPGIFRGPATVSGLCLIPPCPPPPALMIDVTALPEAPSGSDADRIARGLPPLGRDEPGAPPEEEVLGLPPVPDSGREGEGANETLSREESEAPAARQ